MPNLMPRPTALPAALILTLFLGTPALAQSPMNATGFGQLPSTAGCLVEKGAHQQGCGSGLGLAGASAVAISPDGKNLYTGSHIVSNGISVHGAIGLFNRSATDGTLSQFGCLSSDRTDGTDGTAGACDSAPAMNGVNALAVSPDGKNVYAASSVGNSVSTFKRDSDTGALTQTSCLQSPAPGGRCRSALSLLGADSIAVSPDGKSVYVAASYANALDILARDPATGDLTEKACVSNDSTDGICAYGSTMRGPTSVAVSPDGKFVYLGSTASQAIDEFSRDLSTGALTQVGCLKHNAPTAGACTAAKLLQTVGSMTISPDGVNMYVTSSTPSSIITLQRSPSSGLVAEGSCLDFSVPPAPPDNSADTNAGDTTGSSASVTHRAHASQNTNLCASIPGISSVSRVALSPDGHKLYSVGSGNVSIFTRDPAGALAQTACIAADDSRCGIATGLDGPSAAVTSLDGANLYVVSGGNSLTAFGPAAVMPTAHAALHRGGVARIALACPVAARGACAGSLSLATLTARHRRPHGRRHARARSAVLPGTRFRVAPGKTVWLTVPVPRALRARAQRFGSAHLLAATISNVRATGNASRVLVISARRHRPNR